MNATEDIVLGAVVDEDEASEVIRYLATTWQANAFCKGGRDGQWLVILAGGYRDDVGLLRNVLPSFLSGLRRGKELARDPGLTLKALLERLNEAGLRMTIEAR